MSYSSRVKNDRISSVTSDQDSKTKTDVLPVTLGGLVPDRYDVEEAAQRTQIERRKYQMYPYLSDARLAKIAHFGPTEHWPAGSTMFRAGEPSEGMRVVTSGVVEIRARDGLGQSQVFEVVSEKQFLGETATLSGKPYLVDAFAVSDVETILVVPEQLRSLMIAEAQLGSEIMRAFILRRVWLIQNGCGPVLIGSQTDPKLLALTDTLRRANHPHRVLHPESDSDAAQLRGKISLDGMVLPAVVLVNGEVLQDPGEIGLTAALGVLSGFDERRIYDMVVVGSGPAGLASAVYAASEGLSVLVLDARNFGGQAGASARIENYFGFPTGISGHVLVSRAFEQAVKFGANIVIQSRVVRLDCAKSPLEIEIEDGRVAAARTVVIASGASYRRPHIDGLERVDGRGVYFWASSIEGRLCRDSEIVLVGGGNSAGQAIVFLASYASRIHVLIRRDGLADTMSHYLMSRVMGLSNVSIHTRCALESVDCDADGLSEVTFATPHGRTSIGTRHLFLFTGAEPSTDWLRGCGVEVDDKGFVLTGNTDRRDARGHRFAFQTNVTGVFAVGDVRSSSIKRVSSAVGEGAAVVSEIHAFLTDP